MGNDSVGATLDAAKELVERHGSRAREYAAERVVRFEKDGAWPEHAVASLVLTEVERLLAVSHERGCGLLGPGDGKRVTLSVTPFEDLGEIQVAEDGRCQP